MDRVARNRLVLSIIIAVALAVAIAANVHLAVFTGLLPQSQEATDPVAIIEAQGSFDVLYFNVGPYESDFWGMTPIIAIAGIYYIPDPATMPYHIELTDTGYQIAEGEYEWSPELKESTSDRFHLWSPTKVLWYSENAMFKPGQGERVLEAAVDLITWHRGKVLREFFLAVFEAAMTVEEEWRAIEIDILTVGEPAVALGYTEGGDPEYVVTLPHTMMGSYSLFRRAHRQVFIDGRWLDASYYPMEEAVEAGEFTEIEMAALFEAGTFSVIPAISFWGERPYVKGFNHPWQGRELSMPGAT